MQTSESTSVEDQSRGADSSSPTHPTGNGMGLGEGIMAGFLGAGMVALWFFVFDLVRGQLLFTPGSLGSVLFIGAESLEQVRISAGTVLGYTFVHVLLFSLLGVGAAFVLGRAKKAPHLLLGALILFVAMEALFLGALTILAQFLLGSLAWWTIAIGNFLAVLAMAGFFAVRHPGLRSTVFQARQELKDAEES